MGWRDRDYAREGRSSFAENPFMWLLRGRVFLFRFWGVDVYAHASLIVLIASTCYVLTWQVIYFKVTPDYGEKMQAYMVEQSRASGDSPEETQKKDALEEVAKLREEMEQQREQDQEKERELKEKLDELTPGQKDPKLEQAIKSGDYAEAMKRLKELQEELEKKLEEKKKELTEKELEELEELLKKLQEIEAKLMKLMQF